MGLFTSREPSLRDLILTVRLLDRGEAGESLRAKLSESGVSPKVIPPLLSPAEVVRALVAQAAYDEAVAWLSKGETPGDVAGRLVGLGLDAASASSAVREAAARVETVSHERRMTTARRRVYWGYVWAGAGLLLAGVGLTVVSLFLAPQGGTWYIMGGMMVSGIGLLLRGLALLFG